MWALAIWKLTGPPISSRIKAKGFRKGKKRKAPKIFKRTWKIATFWAARLVAKDAKRAVTQVPMLAPKMKAMAVGRVSQPSAAKTITIPVVAAEE